MIRVADPGFFTTVQDLGRYGYAHLGLSPAGAADSLSFRIANLLVGNDQNAPALEMTLFGANLEFETGAIVALTGANCDSKLRDVTAPANVAFDVPAGAVLKCGGLTHGARCYLSVQGGFNVPEVGGSASTLVSGRFGGFRGRRLQGGDVLRIRRHQTSRVRALRPGALDSFLAPRPVRVTRGPQQDWFGPKAFETLLSSPYLVSEQSDRRGLRLDGPMVRPDDPLELLTEGVALGAIQVPPNGLPIILFVDQQTTGGYPKMANVIAADLYRVGQLPPRDEVRFSEVSIAQAVQELREQQRWLYEIFAAS